MKNKKNSDLRKKILALVFKIWYHSKAYENRKAEICEVADTHIAVVMTLCRRSGNLQ